MECKTRTKMVEVSENYFVADDGTEFETEEQCLEYENRRSKYPVNVVFDGELEEAIRNRAKERGIGVATYIKTLVVQDLRKE